MEDKLNATDNTGASVTRGAGFNEEAHLTGWFDAECISVSGQVRWRDRAPNLVVTAGKNFALDVALAGTTNAVTGPYMGLISATSFSTIVAGDTMGSHAGWLEAGNANSPSYTSPRKTAAWNSASGGSKALSSALSFAITSTGTVKGAFLVYGSGASSTIDNTGGTLYSAGLFSGGDRAVLSGDTLNVSYTASL